MERRKQALGTVFGGMALVAFGVLWWGEALRGGAATDFDRAVLLALHRHESPVWDALTWVMAFLGSLWVVLGVALCSVVAALASRRRAAKGEMQATLHHAGRVMPLACVGGTLLVEITKQDAHRLRPHAFVPLFRATGYSFPSGHAFLGLTVFGLLAYFAHKEAVHRDTHPFGRVLLLVGAGLLVFAIGLSRVYAGVHYPTDVLAGWAGGAAWVLVCLRFVASNRFRVTQNGAGKRRLLLQTKQEKR